MSLILQFSLFLILLFETNHAQIHVYNLTQENPSYSIHGVRLKAKQAIMIEGCEKCTLIVDFSLRDPNSNPCTINDHEIDFQKECTKKINDSIDYLFLCSFQYSTRVLLKIGSSLENEFGVGVRVKEWTDDSDSIVYPLKVAQPGNLDGSTIIIGSANGTTGSVATYLARDPINPFSILNTLGFLPYPQSDNCKVWVVAGSHPAKILNNETILLELSNGDQFLTSQLFTSAFSIVVPPKCQVTANAVTGDLNHEFFYYLGEGYAVVTSPEYPWIFDSPNQHSEARLANYSIDNPWEGFGNKERGVDIEILNLQGGTFDLWVLRYDTNQTLINVNNISLDTPTPYTQVENIFVGHIVQYSWAPTTDPIRKGFVLRIRGLKWRYAPSPSPTGDNTTITTITNQPTTVIETTTITDTQLTTSKNNLQRHQSFSIIYIFLFWIYSIGFEALN